jgi:nickel-dependent lactate racemase
VETVDIMIALGTHPAMADEDIHRRLGITARERELDFANARFFNHAWDDPDQLTTVGRIGKDDLRRLTGGLFEINIEVTANRVVRDIDHLVIVGPVFPHEVVGFSGGNKYIFPGISGPEVLHFFHWLSAVITLPKVIGFKWTPVRQVVDTAAAMIPVPRHALCMVVKGDGLSGLYGGPVEEAWSRAADLSEQVHVIKKPRAFHTVVSCAPPMYDEIWVGGKCAYKLDQAVADGGQLIIYGPHIREISVTHGEAIRRIGYHVRDYFLEQWDTFRDTPWSTLAHSTHVKGTGTYIDGVESPRIEVVLATGIPEDECRAINLGYRDPATLDPEDYADREDEGILLVRKAGEILYRIESAPH